MRALCFLNSDLRQFTSLAEILLVVTIWNMLSSNLRLEVTGDFLRYIVTSDQFPVTLFSVGFPYFSYICKSFVCGVSLMPASQHRAFSRLPKGFSVIGGFLARSQHGPGDSRSYLFLF